MKVLIVDQAAAVRCRVASRLREGGLDVVAEVDSVVRACVLAASHQFNAIVADLELADVRGLDVVVALRASAPDAVLVVLTNELHFRRACLANGADHFLDKSTEFDDIVPTLARHLH